MQDEFRVYGRGGEPCDRCGTPIAKTRVGGRGTLVLPCAATPRATPVEQTRRAITRQTTGGLAASIPGMARD